MSTDVVKPAHTTLAAISAAKTPEERGKLQAAAAEMIVDDRFARPVPRFLTELPWGGDTEAITDRIATAILVAEDPDEAQSLQGTTAGKELCGRPVTVHELVVMPGDKPNGWAGYLLLDVTVGDDPVHVVVNTGAKQAVARLARAWAEQDLPLKGVFAEIDGTGRRGTPAVTFLAEKPFEKGGK